MFVRACGGGGAGGSGDEFIVVLNSERKVVALHVSGNLQQDKKLWTTCCF